ncbi:hypothetical protein [Roseateles sp. BYS96W]|uniref:Uncharacterized protein n=1 Tax=Pelomonas nitida TaxID=3299027 RepID=A0ABW7G975_9BURK
MSALSMSNAARLRVWRCDRLAAWLLLAGENPRRRRALPAARLPSPSGAPNCQIQV